MTLPRPHMPVSVQRDACLILLGFLPGEKIEWHHAPALGLRKRLPDGRYDPDANDPNYIVPLRKADHAKQTRGTKATTAGSDVHLIAKGKRLEKAQATHVAIVEAKLTGDTPRDVKRHRIASRPFRQGHRPFQKPSFAANQRKR